MMAQNPGRDMSGSSDRVKRLTSEGLLSEDFINEAWAS